MKCIQLQVIKRISPLVNYKFINSITIAAVLGIILGIYSISISDILMNAFLIISLTCLFVLFNYFLFIVFEREDTGQILIDESTITIRTRSIRNTFPKVNLVRLVINTLKETPYSDTTESWGSSITVNLQGESVSFYLAGIPVEILKMFPAYNIPVLHQESSSMTKPPGKFFLYFCESIYLLFR